MHKNKMPLLLYHYYEAAIGPWHSLSTLDYEEAEALLQHLRREKQTFAAQRDVQYLTYRREIENRMRELFIAKGGRPAHLTPQYMVVGECHWLRGWYRRGYTITIPLAAFQADSISFTYGDSFPAMRLQDGKQHRRQVYTLAELPGVIERYGLPQDWNPAGELGAERYIEAQIWSEIPDTGPDIVVEKSKAPE